MINRAIRKLPVALAASALLAAILATSASAKAPGVTTEGATLISAKAATLNATIETYGHETNWAFDYGTTEEYGSSTEAETIKSGASGPTHVSADIKNLTPGVTYYYRAIALNNAEVEGTLGNNVTVRPLGFYMTGEKSEESSQQPKIGFALSSGLMPIERAHITSEDPFYLFKNSSANVSCDSTTLRNVASTPIRTVSLVGGFTECHNSTVVYMNECRYKYLVANEGPPYTGSVEITCPAGKAIELQIKGVCTIKIPPQAPSSAVSYQDTNYIGKVGAVNFATSASGLTYEKYNKVGNEFLCSLIKGEAGFGGDLLVAPEYW